MAKPSGIKSTDFIDRAAKKFARERKVKRVLLSYTATGGTCKDKVVPWSLYYHSPAETTVKGFKSYTGKNGAKTWMEAEVKRRRILFREYSL
jgi:hypothetical protein